MPKEVTKSTETTPSTEPDVINLEEKIRTRAYQFYEARGHENGHDLDDWLQAESEIARKAA